MQYILPERRKNKDIIGKGPFMNMLVGGRRMGGGAFIKKIKAWVTVKIF